ncbi:MAG: DNA-3-methyladenine glycosylase [Lapillicoccus sp.]
MPRRLPRSFFEEDVLDVAPALLGTTISRHGITVRVTETEAYAGYRHDPGSHAFRGETPRTAPMFGAAGFTYVYFTYGMHWMLCLVTGPVGLAQAVLVRAGEVVDGQDRAAARRPGIAPRDWCRGPARLATTLGLTGADTGLDFCSPSNQASTPGTLDLVVRSAPVPPPRSAVLTGPRVGVSGPGGDGNEYPWRFWLEGEPSVSAYRPGKPRRSRPAG